MELGLEERNWGWLGGKRVLMPLSTGKWRVLFLAYIFTFKIVSFSSSFPHLYIHKHTA